MASNTTTKLASLYTSKGYGDIYKIAETFTAVFGRVLINQSSIVSYPSPPVVFDNGCGTGIISSLLHSILGDQVRQRWELTCGDVAEAMVEYTRQRAKDEGWQNVEVKVADAQATQLASAHYTHVYGSFAYPLFRDVGAAMQETLRILQPGGTLAISTWETVPWINDLKAGVKSLAPDLPCPDDKEFLGMIQKDWSSETHVESVLNQAGFMDVQVNGVTEKVSLPIPELVEVSKTLLPAMLGKSWTQEQREQYEGRIPLAMTQYLEQNHGVGAQVWYEPVCMIATARKPL
ncbi:gliotoxin thiomethyltransferase [Aspergillus lucknowensis]|uniref:S-adenosyl-L-methionine-dependent methyltransferase n=1 Tax=Aspergillus lucknowensis TaxID=176173 RepID=A0ABR4M735_9EURO